MPRLTPDSTESENGSSPSEAYSGDSFCRQGDCSHLVSGLFAEFGGPFIATGIPFSVASITKIKVCPMSFGDLSRICLDWTSYSSSSYSLFQRYSRLPFGGSP